MNISKKFSFAILLTTMLLFPATAFSDSEYFNTQKNLIAEIDNEVEHNIRLRKINEKQQKEIDIWTRDASGWIEQQNRLNQAVNNYSRR